MVRAAIKLSVSVTNYNGAKTLEKTLESVFALDGVCLSRVVLADNNSTDESIELTSRKFPSVIIEKLPDNRGPNPARNAGVRKADTDLVLVMDNDIVLSPDYVIRLIEVVDANPAAGAVSGQVRFYDDRAKVQYNGIDIHYAGEVSARPLDATGTVRVACVSAGAVLLNRQRVLDAGGFDEEFFFGWEDGDLTFRLSLAGYPCFMVSEAIAYHMSNPRGMKWIRLQTRNRWWFIFKNYDLRTIILLFPAIAAFQGCAGLFLLFKGRFPEFLQGTLEAFSSISALRGRRRAVMAGKVVCDRDILRGDYLSLPGGLSRTAAGRVLSGALSFVFRLYWTIVRVFLKHSMQ